ncbi:hypothetical protein, partial [Brachymonas sp. M4Q-1]|uniref:hypothetical protein n=1 Tax=Brachymonas sp. M4Q-1 TaxID=3416906 RepID=UPI003CF15FB0
IVAVANGLLEYKPSDQLRTLSEAIDASKNSDASTLYGLTGGFQAVQGGWYFPMGEKITYQPKSISDAIVESFAGVHDFLGGQMWGWYDIQGNTTRGRTTVDNIGSNVTTILAIPAAAPFALSDLISPDVLQVIVRFKGK